MKNFVHETTGYEYFKKRNDRILKKNSFNDNNSTLCHFKLSMNPAKYTCTTATYIKQT